MKTPSESKDKVDQSERKKLQSAQIEREKRRLDREYLKGLYEQIRIEKEKENRLINEQQQRYEMMRKKIKFDTKSKYAVSVVNKLDGAQEAEDLETPVDGQTLKGSRVFTKNCSSCHGISMATATVDNGPTLGLIFNRKAGIDTTYKGYSRALISKSFYWTAQNLYRFMADPLSLVEGVRCGVVEKPLKSESDRADLLAFFRDYTRQLALNMNIEAIKREGYDKYQTQLYAEKVERSKIQERVNDMKEGKFAQ